MNTPSKNPDELKDRLSAELAARVPERQALLDEAAEVFKQNGTLEDGLDDKPEYLQAMAELKAKESALEQAKSALPSEFEHLENMDFGELEEATQAMILAPDFNSKSDTEKKLIRSLRNAARGVSSAHDVIDKQLQPKSGAIRRMERAKKRLVSPNPETLAEVAKAYSEICDLVDNHTFEVRAYMTSDQTDSSKIARKVEAFNSRFGSWLAAVYLEGNRIKDGENLSALKAKMKSPIESHTNHGITVGLCTKLDGWWMDLSFSDEYHEGVAKERAERHAQETRERAEGERNATHARVESVYADTYSSRARERA